VGRRGEGAGGSGGEGGGREGPKSCVHVQRRWRGFGATEGCRGLEGLVQGLGVRDTEDSRV
jgi:hypothetical protein